MTEPLRIIPLGGLGEVGKNMMSIEYGRNILVVDAGIMFPEADMLGIDFIIPDFNYLRDKKDRVRAILITHGHEDHVGALPYLLREIHAPVYATRLTRGLIEVKLKESKLLSQTTLRTFQAGDTFTIGPFTIEPYHVCHSIPDAVGLGIQKPAGLAVHSGDFKFDHTPVDGRPTDFAKLAEFSGRGVLVLLSDSTNADQPGTTPSEQLVTNALDEVMREAPGRVIVATFASLISRIQQVGEAAARYGRKLAIAGLTMAENVKMARELGYLDFPEGALVTLDEVQRLPPDRVAIMATGAQGEPTAVLGRLALGRHPRLQIQEGDTVVLSAHTIPGNEVFIHRIINYLFQKGADVLHAPLSPVHVSGHASQEEQKLLINLIRPRYFVPIHGELRHLKQHAKMARQLGIPAENIAAVENGYLLEFDAEKLTIGERVPGGYVFVDGSRVGEVGPAVMRDREALAQSGFVVAVVQREHKTGRVVGRPQIITRGFVFLPAAEELIAGAQAAILDALPLDPKPGQAEVQNRIQDALEAYLYRETRRRPMIIPVVMEEQ